MELLTLENLFTLIMLVMLQAVLGFDNLLYISLESQKAPVASQSKVRKWGIGIAVTLRIVLLFVLIRVIDSFQGSLFNIDFPGIIESNFNLHALIVLLGGAFIVYTAMKEVLHMMSLEQESHETHSRKSTAMVLVAIVTMNVVFSIDSILSAMALSDVFIIMAIAIIIGGVLMIWLSDHVSEFLQKNRMYEVLGLFVLFVVGIMLVTEGAHLADLTLFDEPVHAMTKTTFYFVIFVLVITDIVQSRYQSKLQNQRKQLAQASSTQ